MCDINKSLKPCFDFTFVMSCFHVQLKVVSSTLYRGLEKWSSQRILPKLRWQFAEWNMSSIAVELRPSTREFSPPFEFKLRFYISLISTPMRGTDIANLSVCPLRSGIGWKDENGLTYCRSFFTVPNYSCFISIKHLLKIPTASPPVGAINTGGV